MIISILKEVIEKIIEIIYQHKFIVKLNINKEYRCKKYQDLFKGKKSKAF